MKISLNQLELREIIRLLMIGIIIEDVSIEENNIRENEEEKEKDYRCLLLKLEMEAKKNGVKLDFFDNLTIENTTEQTIKELIEKRKRTYTSKY